MKTKIRPATVNDVPFLENLERQSFPVEKQSSRRSIRQSLGSALQQVVILEYAESELSDLEAVGSLTLFRHKNTLRLYSLAVLPGLRGKGLGDQLMHYLLEQALLSGTARIVLEADSQNTRLVAWYETYGFVRQKFLEDFYAPSSHAWKMEKSFESETQPVQRTLKSNVIVSDKALWDPNLHGTEVVSARAYLTEERFQIPGRFRIYNLCDSYRNHSLGYYVSLLASARDQKVVPTVMAIRDFSSVSIAQSVVEEIDEFLQQRLKKCPDDILDLVICFRGSPQKEWNDLAARLYKLFEVPLFRIVFKRRQIWKVKKVEFLTIQSMQKEFPGALDRLAPAYFNKKRQVRTQIKSWEYDMAILVNPQEQTPPSSALALEKFRNAAESCGFFTEFITREDYKRICEFDALFIRETTAVSNHTWRFARRAFTEGLVVMDDPWSILRCSNKLYLYERLQKARIRQPRSWQISKDARNSLDLPEAVKFPIVLKMPESSFSLGVFKVNSREELQERLKQMFQKSELIIAQEFLATPFDWRIGVLDHKPLYACRYHMARDHWQIYNWTDQSAEGFAGDSETLPVEQVPAVVIQTALRASALIGNGLYGVDLKQMDQKAYVIEVNDNPNIDSDIEDLILGDELYRTIMQSFKNRIGAERIQPRFLNL